MTQHATEQSAPAEIGLDQIASRLVALDAGGTPPDAGRATARDARAEALEAEAPAILADENAPDGGQASDMLPPEGEATDAAPADDGQDDAPDSADMITVKIDGKVMRVTREEAAAGYQRQADYSRRMNQLREEAKKLDAHNAAVTAERAQYEQLLGAMRAQLEAAAPQEPDWAKLHAEDPINYPLIRDQWRERQERLAAVQAEQGRLQAMRERERQAALQARVVEGVKWVRDRIPEWKDEQKWDAARAQLREYGQKQGWTAEELSQTYDPRAVLVLEKARRYDALMANRPKPQQQPGPKPLRPSSIASSPKASTEITRQKQRLAKTGRVEDAAVLFGLLDGRR